MGLDVRAARVTWTVLVFVVCGWLLVSARHTILVFIVALFFAYMLSPLVEYLHRRTPKRVSKTLSLAVVYVALIAILVGAGFLLGPRIADEAVALSQNAPALLKGQSIAPPAFIPEWLHPYWSRIVEGIRDRISAGTQEVMPILRTIGTHVGQVASSLLLVVLVPILSFFFLKDAHELYTGIVEMFHGRTNQPLVEAILEDVHFVLGKYMRALILLAVATFVVYLLFFTIAGVPYAALLAAFAAPLEFIPVLGPAVASVSILLVCLFSAYNHVFWVVVFLICYRLFQDYVLSPYLMSEGVELHPLLVIFGVLAGEQIGGVGGMFLSVPVMATARVIYRRFRAERQRQSQHPVETTTPIT